MGFPVLIIYLTTPRLSLGQEVWAAPGDTEIVA